MRFNSVHLSINLCSKIELKLSLNRTYEKHALLKMPLNYASPCISERYVLSDIKRELRQGNFFLRYAAHCQRSVPQ